MHSNSSLRVLLLDPAASSYQVTHNLANHLSELGCDVHVYTAPHWLRATTHDSRKYTVRILFYRGTQLRSYDAKSAVLRFAWRVCRLVQHVYGLFVVWNNARHFDIVHAQILSVPPLDCLCLCAMARHTAVVCTVHELIPHSAWFRRWSAFVFRALYRNADMLFTFTECTRRKLVQNAGVCSDKTITIPHGNLEHLLNLAETTLEQSNSNPVILFIGGIRPDKGLDVLIRAGAHLQSQGVCFTIHVAGTPGFDMREMRALVAELRLEGSVEFRLGYLEEREFAEYLSKATIIALPYRRIEQSGVAIAACTFGKAIVASRCGGLEELVEEAQNGLLVPIDDPNAFADALASLLRDQEKRKLFEEHSRIYARDVLSWNAIAARTIEAYQNVLRERSTRSGLPAQGATTSRLTKAPLSDRFRQL